MGILFFIDNQYRLISGFGLCLFVLGLFLAFWTGSSVTVVFAIPGIGNRSFMNTISLSRADAESLVHLTTSLLLDLKDPKTTDDSSNKQKSAPLTSSASLKSLSKQISRVRSADTIKSPAKSGSMPSLNKATTRESSNYPLKNDVTNDRASTIRPATSSTVEREKAKHQRPNALKFPTSQSEQSFYVDKEEQKLSPEIFTEVVSESISKSKSGTFKYLVPSSSRQNIQNIANSSDE